MQRLAPLYKEILRENKRPSPLYRMDSAYTSQKRLAEHELPGNPLIGLADVAPATKRQRRESGFDLDCFHFFPDGCALKEFIQGARIFKCDVCPMTDNHGIVYSCVHEFVAPQKQFAPNLSRGGYATGPFQERVCWHFRMHGSLEHFRHDSSADRRFRTAQITSTLITTDNLSEDERVAAELSEAELLAAEDCSTLQFSSEAESVSEDASTLQFSEPESVSDATTLQYGPSGSEPESD